jgi:hypothetical protein
MGSRFNEARTQEGDVDEIQDCRHFLTSNLWILNNTNKFEIVLNPVIECHENSYIVVLD